MMYWKRLGNFFAIGKERQDCSSGKSDATVTHLLGAAIQKICAQLVSKHSTVLK